MVSSPKYPISFILKEEDFKLRTDLKTKQRISDREIYVEGLKTIKAKEK